MLFSIQSDTQTLRNRQIGLMQFVDTLVDNTKNVTMLFGLNTWAFPELASSDSLVRVANATPGVADASGQTYTLVQINQAKGLLNYYNNAGSVLGNPDVVSFGTTLNWIVHPSSQGPWNNNVHESTGIIFSKRKVCMLSIIHVFRMNIIL